MELQGRYTFNAPAERVCSLLMDTEAIAGCIPGCEKLEPLGEDRYRATLTVALAAVTGTYQGTVAMVDKQPPTSVPAARRGSGHGQASSRANRRSRWSIAAPRLMSRCAGTCRSAARLPEWASAWSPASGR